MAADLSLLLLAFAFGSTTKLLFLAGCALAIFAVIRAAKRAEIGYEDETGFYFGEEPPVRNKKSSRPAAPCPIIDYSCQHSRSREPEEQRRKSIRHSHLPKIK